MKINICTINLNGEEGRQTIYWDTEDKRLHSTAEDPDADSTEYRCETLREAWETTNDLWNWGSAKGNGWDLEWIEPEEDGYPNELTVTFAGMPDQWIYFTTCSFELDEAYKDFKAACNSVGIDLDNMRIAELELHTVEDGIPVDYRSFKEN